MTKMTIYYFRQAQSLGLALVLLLLNASCGQTQLVEGVPPNSPPPQECSPDSLPPARSAFTIQEGPITEIAAKVSKGAGKVIASGQGSTNRTIFVFEERHDSRIGQLEIALMLWRLQKNQGLRQISLEGAFFAKGNLPVKWFHDLTSSPTAKQAGQETALSLLREGEINAAEFIALAQPEVQVKGNEIESEYNVEASKSNSALGYLVGIAEKSLTVSDARRVNDLVKAKKLDEALDTILSRDAWAKDQYQKMFGDNITSTEESIVILGEIERKARELGVNIESPQEAGFREDLNFFRTASKRSCTIVKNTLAMMDSASTAPVALLIGAAHTPKVVELIKAANLNYVVLSPLSLVTPTRALKLDGPMYSRKVDLKSVDGEGMLGALLDGRKKPRPVLGKQWFTSKAGIYTVTNLIIAAAARNERMPSEILKTELQSFPSIRIDWSSIKITREGNQVHAMYKLTAQTSDLDPQQTATIWVSCWQSPPSTGDPISPGDSDVEKLILDILDKGRKPPKGSEPPIPGSSGPVPVIQLSTKTKAAFSTDPILLQQVTVAR